MNEDRTPRTDALLARYGDTTAWFSYLGDLEKLCRQIERENATMRRAHSDNCLAADQLRGRIDVLRIALERVADIARHEPLGKLGNAIAGIAKSAIGECTLWIKPFRCTCTDDTQCEYCRKLNAEQFPLDAQNMSEPRK